MDNFWLWITLYTGCPQVMHKLSPTCEQPVDNFGPVENLWITCQKSDQSLTGGGVFVVTFVYATTQAQKR